MAELLTGDAAATPADAVERLQRFVTDLEIPRLRISGLEPATMAELVEKSPGGLPYSPDPKAGTQSR